MLNSFPAPRKANWCRILGTHKEKIPPKVAAHNKLLALFLGIVIYSGVCLVLNLNRPIFAFEREKISKEVKEIEISTSKENFLEEEWF